MKLIRLNFLFVISVFLFSINSIFASPVLDGLNDIVTDIQAAFTGTDLGIGFSFLLLTIIFTVLFKQGTARMLPNHSNGAVAISIVMAIFASIGILAQIDDDTNPLVIIGKNILIPLLLFALFFGSWALLRGISNAQVSGFGKFLMYIGFFVLFLFAFLSIIGFAAGTIFENLFGAFSWLGSFLWGLLIFFFILFLVLLFGGIFLIKEFIDIFDGDDDSALARSRKKKKQKAAEDKDVIEKLNLIKKSFHKMRLAYDDKEEILKQVSRMEPIDEMIYDENSIPGRNSGGRY